MHNNCQEALKRTPILIHVAECEDIVNAILRQTYQKEYAFPSFFLP